MKIILESDSAVLLEESAEPMTVEAASGNQSFSPFHMLASGLASCTWSVLYSWAEQAGLHAQDLRIRVEWSFAEDPHRVGEMRTVIEWPGLPQERRAAAERVAALCAVHQTLTHPPAIVTEIRA